MVNLVVSNPNKRVPSPSPLPLVEIKAAANDVKTNHATSHKATIGLRTSAPPSRPTTPTAGKTLPCFLILAVFF